ncbi:MAG: ubiquinone biosynthesis protein [Sterolibacterium sp.]
MLDRAALLALNHLLQGASWARARLAPFAGKSVRLSLPPLQLELSVNAEGLFEQADPQRFDVDITLPADTPLLALRGWDATLKATHISGSAEFADALGFVLRNLRWDFEEDLSQHVGDIAAHRIAGLFSSFTSWQRQAGRNLAENIAEYLTEENPTLAKPEVVETFSKEVGQLRDDLRQLEQRVANLGG